MMQTDTPQTWVPPILGDVVVTVRSRTVCRFYPFMSLINLCFSSGPRFWLGEGLVALASIGLDPDEEYLAFDVGPYGGAATTILATRIPEQAVAEG